MAKLTTLADIERAHRLVSNHTAMAILDALGHGQGLPDAAALSVNRQTVNDAVALLGRMGLVKTGPGSAARSDVQTVVLTSHGQSVVDLLDDAPHGTG